MERELLLMLVFIVHWIVLSATVNELQGYLKKQNFNKMGFQYNFDYLFC